MADIARVTHALKNLNVRLTKDTITEFSTFASGAKKTLVGDLFYLGYKPSEKVFIDTGARGIQQRFLLDPEKYETTIDVLKQAKANYTIYGELPLKNHAKGYVRDNEDAFLTTGAFVAKTNDRLEFVATFSGDGARALQGLTDAAIGGNVMQMRQAAVNASKYGIVINESKSQSTFLTDSLLDLIRNAKTRLVISTKIYTDVRVARLVDDARARGVNVAFTDIRAQGMHGNLVIADDGIYLGTAHLSARGLGDLRYAYRQSRELGLVQHDAALATSLLKRMDDLGMKLYTPEQFSRTSKAYSRIDAKAHQDDLIYKLKQEGKPVEAAEAKLVELTADSTAANAEWREITKEVTEARKADGLTFSNFVKFDAPAAPRLIVDKPQAQAAAAAALDQALAAGEPGMVLPGAAGAGLLQHPLAKPVGIGLGLTGTAGAAYLVTRG